MDTAILRSRILDMAIRGQLVPQDPNEGTADDLLKTIATQRGKPVTPITDNVPFDIPANWRWVKLGDIVVDMADGPFGSNLKKEHYTINREARIIQLSNIGENGWREENTKYTSFEHAKNNITRSIVQPGNLVIAKMMPAGRTIICPNNEAMYVLSSDSIKCVLADSLDVNFVHRALNSAFFRSRICENVQGVTRARTSIKKLKEAFLPLPPLAEQHRIVAKVEELLSEVDKIEQAQADITQAATILRSRVLDSALKGELTHSNTEEWTWDSITNVTDPISSRDSQIKTSEIMPCGKYAVVSQGQKLIDGYCDDESRVITTLPVILFGDHTRNVKFIDFPFVVGADGTKLHKCKSIDPKFCYYWILWAADNMTNRGYERHYSLLKQTPLHLPPLAEQHRIVAKIEQLFTEIDKLVK